MPPKKGNKSGGQRGEDGSGGAGSQPQGNRGNRPQSSRGPQRQQHQGGQQRRDGQERPSPGGPRQQADFPNLGGQAQQQTSSPQATGPSKPAWGKPAAPVEQPTPAPQTPVQSAPQAQARASAQPKQQPEQQPQTKQPREQGQLPKETQSSTDKTMAKMVAGMEKIKLTNDEKGIIAAIPKRKDPFKAGTIGVKIKVLTNMMEIKFGKCPREVLHYDVDIIPDKPKYMFRRIFEAARSKKFPNRFPAYDAKKNAYSASPLPIQKDGETIEVKASNDDGKEMEYKVTIKYANTLDFSWFKNVTPGIRETERDKTSLQALNVIISRAPAMRTVPVGRSFFSQPEGRVIELGGGMDLWVGLFQSAIVGWKPFLNVDVAHKGFPSPKPVLQAIEIIICDSIPRRYNDPPPQVQIDAKTINNYKKAIESYLKNLRISTNVLGVKRSRQVVNGLINKNSYNDFFEIEDEKGIKRTISIYDYFKNMKKYTIKYPELPTLWVGPRNKNTHVPLEICQIEPGQAIRRKLDEKQTAQMVRTAATGTADRQSKIMQNFQKINHNQDPCMKEFGISITGQFAEVEARILPAPLLDYDKKSATVNKGVWRTDNFRFLKPSMSLAKPESWTILNLQPRLRTDVLIKFQQDFIREGNKMGMQIGDPFKFETMSLRKQRNSDHIDMTELRNYFSECKKYECHFIFVIIANEPKNAYNVVKQVAELNVGILTQCLQSNTVERKMNPATLANILQKVNAKLNGSNHCISNKCRPQCLNQPCMIVGMDVTHPSPDSTGIPSIAAVAASHDPNAFQYNIEIRLQPPRVEIIQDLSQIMQAQLKFFFAKTRQKPGRIIIYRDGVSEGQFAEVMARELTAIRKACSLLSVDYKPLITFLVVQKRHHTRLFPTRQQDSDDKNFNVKAGTVVDTTITHPSDIDFYLVSHASIQGTARPTKYRCLHDDADMSEDDIEQLTYFLCHMFTRCSRSVSYPAPTYYAHLAAFRARNLIQDVDIDLNKLQEEQEKKLKILELRTKNPMFFV